MRTVTAWIFDNDGPKHKFEFNIPSMQEHGFYRTILSLEAFRNRELIRNFTLPYSREARKGFRVSIRYEYDEVYNGLSYKEVPITKLNSLEEFYEVIGYSKGMRRDKFLRSWKPTLTLP